MVSRTKSSIKSRTFCLRKRNTSAETSGTQHRYINANKPTLGSAYINGNKLINSPMDFTEENRFSATDFDSIIKRVIFPQLFGEKARFNILPAYRELLKRYMAMQPSNSVHPTYQPEQFADNFSKFLLFGGEPLTLLENVRIFNKTG